MDRPAIYRTFLIAFLAWSAHFIVSYGAVLIFPGQGMARIIAILAGLVALAVLIVLARRLAVPRSPLALGALGIAGAGIVFGTFPAVVG